MTKSLLRQRAMADSHLTYIGAVSRNHAERARYDVYPRGGGPQLGWVVKYAYGWLAIAPFGKGGSTTSPIRRTRWEAASMFWPEERS